MPEVPKGFHTVLSTMHAYQCYHSIHCTAYFLSMLMFNWNKIFYLLIKVLHYHYVIDDVIVQEYWFSAGIRNKLRLHKQNIHFYQLLNVLMKIILQYSKILWIILCLSHKKLQIIISTIN